MPHSRFTTSGKNLEDNQPSFCREISCWECDELDYCSRFLESKPSQAIYNFYPNDWKQLPIPDVSPEQQEPIVKLVDQILDAKRTNLDADVCELEDEIDQLVYELYDLTPNEVEIVDGNP